MLFVMSMDLGAHGRTRVLRVALLAACGALLAACGTPATVTPATNPLPGFTRAIKDAQNAAAQASYDNGVGSTNVTVPTVTTP